jgi:hypothetical protein
MLLYDFQSPWVEIDFLFISGFDYVFEQFSTYSHLVVRGLS